MRQVKHKTGIRHPAVLKLKAKGLRAAGRTHREIAKELGISIGSAHLWTTGVEVTSEQKAAIEKRRNERAFSQERRKRLAEMAKIRLAPYREKYTRGGLLKKILDFYKKHQRIPLKREFNMYREYFSRFGSWNNAIIAAGFDPNPEIFSKKFIAQDGHRCDSFSEKVIDDWLFSFHIGHERSVRYGSTKFTSDFLIKPDTVIEFFGLAGVQKAYDEIIKKKRKMAKNLNLNLIEVYPNDLFPKNRLAEKLPI